MNKFDEYSGVNNPNELNGMFSFIEDGIKSAVEKVTDVTSKIAQKVLPSSVRDLGRKMDKSGFNKIAAGAALAAIGIPAIAGSGAGAAIGSAASKAGALAVKGASMVKSGIVGIGKIAGSKAAADVVKLGTNYVKMSGEAKQKEQAAAIAAQQAAEHEAEVARRLTVAMGKSPKFQQAVQDLRGQGYTDEQILQHWVQSKTYYMTAVNNAMREVYPQMTQQLESRGVPPQTARQVAEVEAHNTAKKAVDKVKGEVGGGNLTKMLPLVGAALLFLNK